jgi:hypothetical protein
MVNTPTISMKSMGVLSVPRKLLQWLSIGEDYQPHHAPGTPSSDVPEQATVTAFVDDLQLFSASTSGMATRLKKLDAFCEWSGMEVSMGKTMSTCLKYGRACNARERMEDALRINGHPIHFLTSHETYKYLGIHYRADLSDVDHCAVVRATLIKHIHQLQESALFSHDVWHLAETVLFPKACYGFGAVHRGTHRPAAVHSACVHQEGAAAAQRHPKRHAHTAT